MFSLELGEVCEDCLHVGSLSEVPRIKASAQEFGSEGGGATVKPTVADVRNTVSGRVMQKRLFFSTVSGKVKMQLDFVHPIPNLKTESEAFATAFVRQPKQSVISSLGREMEAFGTRPSSLGLYRLFFDL